MPPPLKGQAHSGRALAARAHFFEARAVLCGISYCICLIAKTFLFSLLFCCPLSAQQNIGDNDFRISNAGPNGNTNFAAESVAIAYNSSDDEYFIVWSADDSSDEEFEIYGQRIDARDGSRIGAAIRISDMGTTDGDTDFDALRPAVAYNSTANEYLVVWEGDDDTGSLVDGEFEIYGQRINAATGAPVGTNDFRISDAGASDGDTNFDAAQPDVAYNSQDDEYLVVWEGDDDTGSLVNGEFEIFAQRLDASDGSAVGANDFRISDMGSTDGDAAFDAVGPAITYNANDNEYLVVWEGDDDTGSLVNGEFEIFVQRISGVNGSELGTNDQRISDMGASDGDFSFSAVKPRVTYNSLAREYLVVWQGDDDSGSLVDGENEIYAQRIDAQSGTSIGSNDARISDMGASDGSTNFNALAPALAFSTVHNRFLIVWTGDDDSGMLVNDEFEVFGQAFGYVSDLSISKTAVQSPAIAGDTLDYTLSVNNLGPNAALTSITVTDTLPANTSFVTASGNGWTCIESMGLVSCSRATAALGAAPDILLSVQLNQSTASPMSNTASVNSATFDSNSGNNSDSESSTVTTRADLFVTISDSADPLLGGNTLTYTIASSNDGPSDAVNVSNVIELPEENSAITSITASGWTCSTATNTVSCTRATLAAGSSANISITVDIPKDLSTIISATTTISSATTDNDSTNNTASSETQILSGVDHDGDGIPSGLDPDDDGDDLSDDDENTIGSDPLNPDTDGDGLRDGPEVALGTDPLNADTDKDLSNDGDEVTNRSDPLDSGSKRFSLPTELLLEWNAHFPPMFSVLENTGLSAGSISLNFSLLDSSGEEESVSGAILSLEQQLDLLVHDMSGFIENTYGSMKIGHNGVPGDYDGRIVQYKLGIAEGNDIVIEHALAVPAAAGERGRQFVPFNTFHPSLRESDRDNLVTNWIQLSNISENTESGSLYLWSQSGDMICERRLQLDGKSRLDVGVHAIPFENENCPRLGSADIGLVEWRPDSDMVSFVMRNVRYYYDNAGERDSLYAASLLTANKGTRRQIVAPFDRDSATAVVEVANTSDSFQTIELSAYDSAGTLLISQSLGLAAKASAHTILDGISTGDIGHVRVKGDTINGAQAYVLQYGRTFEDPPGLSYAYATSLEEPLTMLSRASFNTYFEQDCRVLLSNPGNNEVTFDYSLLDDDGNLISNASATLDANSTTAVDCKPGEISQYGTFRLEAGTALSGILLREASDDSYRVQLPLR